MENTEEIGSWAKLCLIGVQGEERNGKKQSEEVMSELSTIDESHQFTDSGNPMTETLQKGESKKKTS